jgi:hypothetical protein
VPILIAHFDSKILFISRLCETYLLKRDFPAFLPISLRNSHIKQIFETGKKGVVGGSREGVKAKFNLKMIWQL